MLAAHRAWKVVTWKKENMGGEGLAFVLPSPGSPTEGFVVATGPSPWGSGWWGVFPEGAATSAREPRLDDSWPVSGCPSERWSIEQLLDSLVSYERYTGWPQSRTRLLAALVERLQGLQNEAVS